MDAIRSIVVHLDGSPRAAARLQLARALAADHEAELTALLAVAPAFSDVPLAYAGGGDAATLMQKIDDDRREQARAVFERERERPGARMQWSELGYEPTIGGFIQHGLLSELLVLGQRDPDDAQAFGVPSDFVESVAIGSGRPTLVLPYVGDFAPVHDRVLIAWKPTREAARAVAGALPLLRRARQIHVVRATEEDELGRVAEISHPRLDTYLQRQGVKAPVEQHSGAQARVGEALLSLASDVSADLLVMGCYGHTRAREMLLGGVTRTVLASMTLPVLIAH